MADVIVICVEDGKTTFHMFKLLADVIAMVACYVRQYSLVSYSFKVSWGTYTAYDCVYCDTQLLVFRFSFLHIT